MIVELTQALERGSSLGNTLSIKPRVTSRVDRVLQTDAAEIEHPATNAALLILVEEFALARQICLRTSDWRGQAISNSKLGILFVSFICEDADYVKRMSATVIGDAAKLLENNGDMRSAAIESTNASVALLQLRRPSDDELAVAKQYLDFSLVHKIHASEDWAYSQFNLGLYFTKLRAGGLDARVQNLQRARAKMLGGLTILRQSLAGASPEGWAQFARTSEDLFELRTTTVAIAACLANIDSIPAHLHGIANRDTMAFVGSLESNPAAYGLDRTPDWLQNANTSSARDLFAADNELALQQLRESTGSDRDTPVRTSDRSEFVNLIAARLRWLDTQTRTSFDELIEVFLDSAAHVDPEGHFQDGCRIISEFSKNFMQVAPLNVLESTSNAFVRIVENRSRSTIEPFLQSRPGQIRFIACEMFEYGKWADGFDLLETARLIFRDLGRPGPYRNQDAKWCHLTHSPRSSYIVKRELVDGRPITTGKAVRELDGPELVRLAVSFADGARGLVNAQTSAVPQSSQTSELNAAIDRSLSALAPVGRQVSLLFSPEDNVSLITSGLYASLPVVAVIENSNGFSSNSLVVVPSERFSRRSDGDKPPQFDPWSAMTVVEVGSPPNLRALRYPSDEAGFLKRIVTDRTTIEPNHYPDATISKFKQAASDSRIFHFTGHSMVDFEDSRRSVFALQDGSVSADEIAGLHDATGTLATLSSCQSGLTSTLTLADEYIGLHTAFVYCGYSAVVGTLWPVYDVASFVFISKLYANLLEATDLSAPKVHLAVRKTGSWIRQASINLITEFFDDRAVIWVVPSSMTSAAGSSVPFAHPRHWAAYFVTASSAS